MPIYEYRCQDCGHYTDVLQKLSEDPLKLCPECQAPEGLRRLISAPAFRLKGGGWYETDFKSDKEKRRNLADGGARAESGGESSSGGGESSSGGEAASANGASKSSEGGSKSGDGGSKSGDGGSKSNEGGSRHSEGSGRPSDKPSRPGNGPQSKAAV